MATFAGIDCGTNSIRLLIIERTPAAGTVDVLRTMRVVRLGEGLDQSGVIAPAALERTFAACREYAELIDAHQVERVRFMATSASRDAGNRDEFIAGVEQIMGVRPEIITGAEEAELSFAGAVGSSAVRAVAPGPRLVVDIGGGSTEFVLGLDVPSAARSVDIGCVRLAERWLRSDPPGEDELADLVADADAAIARAGSAVQLDSAASLIGVAGTVTTVAALALGLPEYDPKALHGAVISAGDVHRVALELAAMTLAQRLALPVMHPGRADVIVSGAMIWSRIVRAVGVPQVVVSEHDILDGVAQSAAQVS
ncbi:MAG: Ppx/GppA family phosphatase [Actinobacteria bacterium]|nr:MAG: Ppx/GppA family phosphatase [Actinomycetota bacterium]